MEKLLFKYRDWADNKHKEWITDNIVYMASPKSFEDDDPLDCRNPIAYHLLSDEELRKYIESIIKRVHPKWNDEAIANEVEQAYKRNNYNDPKFWKEHEDRYNKLLDSKAGILCLCGSPINLTMWNKYGSNLKGFCIGYDYDYFVNNENNLLFGGGSPINYEKKLPPIHPNDSDEDKYAKQYFYKLEKYTSENEYRISKMYDYDIFPNDRKIKIERNAIKYIYFGALMPKKHQDEIIEACRVNKLEPKVYRISPDSIGSEKLLPINMNVNW